MQLNKKEWYPINSKFANNLPNTFSTFRIMEYTINLFYLDTTGKQYIFLIQIGSFHMHKLLPAVNWLLFTIYFTISALFLDSIAFLMLLIERNRRMSYFYIRERKFE